MAQPGQIERVQPCWWCFMAGPLQCPVNTMPEVIRRLLRYRKAEPPSHEGYWTRNRENPRCQRANTLNQPSRQSRRICSVLTGLVILVRLPGVQIVISFNEKTVRSGGGSMSALNARSDNNVAGPLVSTGTVKSRARRSMMAASEMHFRRAALSFTVVRCVGKLALETESARRPTYPKSPASCNSPLSFNR